MNILVVEPHTDDAFLSLGWHLENIWREHDRTILTVYANKKRTKEAQDYANTIQAESIVLELLESKMLSELKEVKPLSEVNDFLDKFGSGYDHIIFPLGLQHPDHLRVAASAPLNSWKYLDTPYQAKQKLAYEVLDKTLDMTIKSIAYPGAKKWKHIPIFKSQSKFFHFNDMTKLKMPEIVLG